MSDSSGLLRRYEDSYSTGLVDDMLQGVNEWQNIQEVVRLTFKALTEIVRSQGHALKEAERQIKGLRAEVAAKPWTSDVREAVEEMGRKLVDEVGKKPWLEDSERRVQMEIRGKPWMSDLNLLAQEVDAKASREQVARMVEDKVSFSEMEEVLAGKANLEDITDLAEAGVHLRDVEAEVHQLEFSIKQLEAQNTAALPDSMQHLFTLLEDKVSQRQLQEALEPFPSQDQLADLLSRKADTSELQRIFAALETKAEHEALDALADRLETDQREFTLRKPDLSDDPHLLLQDELQLARSQTEHYMAELESRVNQSLQQMTGKIDELHSEVQRTAYRKGEFEELKALISRKTDLVLLNESLAKVQLETNDTVGAFRAQLQQQQKQFEDLLFEKMTEVEQLAASSSRESDRLRSLLQSAIEDRRRDAEDQGRLAKTITAAAKAELRSDLSALAEHVDRLQQFMDDTVVAKISRSEFREELERMNQAMLGKADVAEVQRALGISQKDAAQHFVDTKDEFKGRVGKLEGDLMKLVNNRPTFQDLEEGLKTKADEPLVSKALATKANVEELSALAEEVEKAYGVMEDCVRVKQYLAGNSRVERVLEEIGKEVILRASIKDVCTLLDLKASNPHTDIEDVNQALQDIHTELDSKVPSAELTDQLQDTQLLLQTLSAETCVGRWLWKSGEIRGSYAVPWELQSVNTCPENFLWEKDSTTILTNAPGLYEVVGAFYARKRPTVQLLVNGDVVVSVKNFPE